MPTILAKYTLTPTTKTPQIFQIVTTIANLRDYLKCTLIRYHKTRREHRTTGLERWTSGDTLCLIDETDVSTPRKVTTTLDNFDTQKLYINRSLRQV
ncbi:hypothetical protein HanRHA438_Chr05g0218251 [Helianthus annuus]|nr:hypothetical protein HanRHA438_Chr05g0218251 [Helianthus annuus]